MNIKKFLIESMYSKMEKDKDNNIFNNMNNFSRDEHVFEETIKHCVYFFEELLEDRDRLQKGMNHFYTEMVKAQDELKGKNKLDLDMLNEMLEDDKELMEDLGRASKS